jgi:hypothetical protein
MKKTDNLASRIIICFSRDSLQILEEFSRAVCHIHGNDPSAVLILMINGTTGRGVIEKTIAIDLQSASMTEAGDCGMHIAKREG